MHPYTLLAISRLWFRFGLISWGGMYAMLPRLESEMESRGWLTPERFQEAVAACVLVPGPTFVTLAGMTGYQIQGYAGSVVAIISLMVPPTMLVVGAMLFVTPEMLAGPLAPVSRGLTVAVVGVLLGTAWRFAYKAPRYVWRGPLLLTAITGAVLLGVPVTAAVVAGVVLGGFLMRRVGA